MAAGWTFVVFAAVLLVLVHAQTPMENCTYTNALTQETYDLSSLTIPVNNSLDSFYNFEASNNTISYIVNICAPVPESSGCIGNTSVCQVQNTSSAAFSCGMVTFEGFSLYTGESSTNDEGVQLIYSHGDYCYSYGYRRSTAINIGCAPGQQTVISSVIEEDCVYTIQMWSEAGCAISIPESSSATPIPSPSGTPSASISTNSSNPVSVTNSISVTSLPSISAEPSLLVSDSVAVPTPTISISLDVSSTVTASTNFTSTEPTIVPSMGSLSASPSDTGTQGIADATWVWYVLTSLSVIVIIITAVVSGVLVYLSKRQSAGLDPVDYLE